ncbi:MAG: UDP-N-acetylglucosamine 2-epimerase [Alphaproteobacteria bacterium]|nr:UDP-N-acetylglucosamine 2-epimerase [Alphaproteobacteria bacterium]
MTERHIAVLTGKRGGFGAMRPMLRALDNDSDMRLSLIITDQHVNPAFGATVAEIERDFTVAAAVDMEQVSGQARDRARALGICATKMAGVLADLEPDILVLYGDRGEVLATAMVAINLGIPIAHVQGGDISGNVDELMRHAVTKLSHLHFTSNADSAARVRALGEESWRVHVVGDNHVDPIVAGSYTDAPTVRRRYGIEAGAAPIIVLYHPETTQPRDGYRDMQCILDVVLARTMRTIIVYPCSDKGYEDIIKAIEEVRDHAGVSIHANIEASDFYGLLTIAAVMVGNSSAGLIETPYVPLPAVNVGDRQQGRRHAENVIHCGHGADELDKALETAVDDPAFAARVAGCERPFGDGHTYLRIVETLKSVTLEPCLFDKHMTM